MSNVEKEIMKQKIKQQESKYMKYFFKMSENVNIFFYDILCDFSVTIWIPFLSDLLQYIHIFYYPFKENLSTIFKQKEFVNKFTSIYQYILFFPLIKSYENLIIFISVVVILIIFLTFISLIIISTCEKSRIKYYNILVTMMRYILPTISMTFFGRIFDFLILLYLCEENEDNEDETKYNSFKCPNSIAFYLFSILCIIALILLLIISYITILIYFKPLL